MEQLLNVKELAAHLKCTEQTVRRYVMKKKIPYRKIDRMVRFWPSEIKEWVNSGKAKKMGVKNGGLFAENEITETAKAGESQ
ncbi:MAG: helix-turn-helix domain-containing protein [Treponema sp.]|nr:helix-turn-helix domain-containing protein [Treponema sp.]